MPQAGLGERTEGYGELPAPFVAAPACLAVLPNPQGWGQGTGNRGQGRRAEEKEGALHRAPHVVHCLRPHTEPPRPQNKVIVGPARRPSMPESIKGSLQPCLKKKHFTDEVIEAQSI